MKRLGEILFFMLWIGPVILTIILVKGITSLKNSIDCVYNRIKRYIISTGNS